MYAFKFQTILYVSTSTVQERPGFIICCDADKVQTSNEDLLVTDENITFYGPKLYFLLVYI